MQEVVCFNCGRIVHISPDAQRCSVCGENLSELIHPASASTYFYDRAATMATQMDLLQALREIDRGLHYSESTELHLLGAILSERIGDFEQMRWHVGAIPVDDVLRAEAEWLLRAHQTRQREARTASRHPTTNSVPLTERDPLPPLPDELALATTIDTTTDATTTYLPDTQLKYKRNRVFTYFSLLLVVIIIGTVLFSTGMIPLTIMPWNRSASGLADNENPLPVTEPVRLPVDDPSSPPLLDVDNKPTDAPDDSTPTIRATATAVPDPNVPEDVVLSEPEPIAETTAGALLIDELQPFDLDVYLRQAGYPELADLDVAASSQDGTFLLDGVVPSAQDKENLLALLENAPGVVFVSGADILVRLPPTYTVEAGDTLWAISAKLYGGNRISALLEANQGVLTSPNALTVGMVLSLPPYEDIE